VGGVILYKQLLEAAEAKIPNTPVLINAVAKRVRQLHAGQRPYIKPEKGDEAEDIALREIAEGKIIVEIDFSAMTENKDESEG
jgi:DNA-directed RNA polymerase omega subunit